MKEIRTNVALRIAPTNDPKIFDVSGRGFTTASLGSGIKIAASGVDTLITIGADSIRLVGVTNTLLSSANFKF